SPIACAQYAPPVPASSCTQPPAQTGSRPRCTPPRGGATPAPSLARPRTEMRRSCSSVNPPQRIIQRVVLVHLVNPPHGFIAVPAHRPTVAVVAQADGCEVVALLRVVRLHDPARTANRAARFLHPGHVGKLGAGDSTAVLRPHPNSPPCAGSRNAAALRLAACAEANRTQ